MVFLYDKGKRNCKCHDYISQREINLVKNWWILFKNFFTPGHRLQYWIFILIVLGVVIKFSSTIVDFYIFYGGHFDRYIKQCKCLKRYDLNLSIEQTECYVILWSSALSIEMSVVSSSVVVAVEISISSILIDINSDMVTLPHNHAVTIHHFTCK